MKNKIFITLSIFALIFSFLFYREYEIKKQLNDVENKYNQIEKDRKIREDIIKNLNWHEINQIIDKTIKWTWYTLDRQSIYDLELDLDKIDLKNTQKELNLDSEFSNLKFNRITLRITNLDDKKIDFLKKLLSDDYTTSLEIFFEKGFTEYKKVFENIALLKLQALYIDDSNIFDNKNYDIKIMNAFISKSNSKKINFTFFPYLWLPTKEIDLDLWFFSDLEIDNFGISLNKENIKDREVEELFKTSHFLKEIYIYDYGFFRKKDDNIVFSKE